MKRFLLLSMLLVLYTGIIYAENSRNSVSAGFGIGEIGDDLNFGFRITSPFLFSGHAAARISGGAAWKNLDWSPYTFLKAGLIGTGGIINSFARLYGEGGLLLLINEEQTGALNWGGYGNFGFEFFTDLHSPVSYFIEMGTTGISISRLNGFNVKTGLEIYF